MKQQTQDVILALIREKNRLLEFASQTCGDCRKHFESEARGVEKAIYIVMEELA
jgi:hypothetical protein